MQAEVKQRHPGFTASNETAVAPGRTARPQETIRSEAVKQLNREGYYVYNTPEKQDVYITIQPDTAFFDDDEPKMVRMAGGSFVSGSKRADSFTVPVRSEPEPEPMDYTQPADIFNNAKRRPVYEEIDFQIIIKKNDSFEKELEEAELYSPLSCREVVDPVLEEQVFVKKQADMAFTSADAAAPIMMKETIIGYAEPSDYEVEDTTAAEETTKTEEKKVPIKEEPIYVEKVVIKKVHTAEVPAGLHVEGKRPTDVAKMNVGATEELSSFNGKSTAAQTAATSGSKPAEAALPIAEQIPVVHKTKGVINVTEAVPCAVAEKNSETVTGPTIIAIADEIEMLKITIPGLCICDELMSDMSADCIMVIPDDGLEAYDCAFKSAPTVTSSVAAQAASGSDTSLTNVTKTTPFKFKFK